MAKLLSAQKQHNAAILADAATAKCETKAMPIPDAKSNTEYLTVLAVSDESLNEEEHTPVNLDGVPGSAPINAHQLTPIIEMALTAGQSNSDGPSVLEASFDSASIDPMEQVITSPTGGTEGTGIESILSLLDDARLDGKQKLLAEGKYMSEQAEKNLQMGDVSFDNGTFDDDLSNAFAPRLPSSGGTGKWFW